MNLDHLKADLKRDEGIRLKPYRDSVGKLSVGVGRNLDDVGVFASEVELMLDNDIARTVAELENRLPWFSLLDEVRQLVLVNMAFNMGVAGLLTFSNTLEAVRVGAYEVASSGMLASLWARQVGPRAVRLAAMMRSGQRPLEVGP